MSHRSEEERRSAEEKAAKKAEDHERRNRKLLSYLGATPEPWPTTESTATYTVFSDNLEVYLDYYWQAWRERKQALVRLGEGFDGKHAPTYREAARTAETDPPYHLVALLEHARLLTRR